MVGQLPRTAFVLENSAEGVAETQVSDEGIGISEEQQARLFSAFVQADATTTRRYGGTGLGLSICKHLVENMGGRIGVEAGAEGGACFYFTLPRELP